MRKHLRRHGVYSLVNKMSRAKITKYFLWKYNSYKKLWVVDKNRENGCLKCSCMKLESKSIPCCHIFRVLVLEDHKKFWILLYSLCGNNQALGTQIPQSQVKYLEFDPNGKILHIKKTLRDNVPTVFKLRREFVI